MTRSAIRSNYPREGERMNRIEKLIEDTVDLCRSVPGRAQEVITVRSAIREAVRPHYEEAGNYEHGECTELTRLRAEFAPLFAEEKPPINVWQSGLFLHPCGCVTSTDGGRLIATCTSPSRCTRVKK